eukprot:TRINITY_DN4689_c0_g2_i1.p1 TRINITY_DN4689_c0_g2~~TRINITY_DN4689_c0_g2_i1.p1  ORF type:complete len:637 (+),score=117.17 TRINITY_DN4689_c0_g2_i1:22-1911(+)
MSAHDLPNEGGVSNAHLARLETGESVVDFVPLNERFLSRTKPLHKRRGIYVSLWITFVVGLVSFFCSVHHHIHARVFADKSAVDGSCKVWSCGSGHGPHVACVENKCRCEEGFVQDEDMFQCIPYNASTWQEPGYDGLGMVPWKVSKKQLREALPIFLIALALFSLVIANWLYSSIPRQYQSTIERAAEGLYRQRTEDDRYSIRGAVSELASRLFEMKKSKETYLVGCVLLLLMFIAIFGVGGMMATITLQPSCSRLRGKLLTEDYSFNIGWVMLLLSYLRWERYNIMGFQASLAGVFRGQVDTKSIYGRGFTQLTTLIQLSFRFIGMDLLVISLASRAAYPTFTALLFVLGWLNVLDVTSMASTNAWRKMWKLAVDKSKKGEGVRFSPNNCYMDLTQPFALKVLVIFAGQVVLFGVYFVVLKSEGYQLLCDWPGEGSTLAGRLLLFLCCIVIQFLTATQSGSSFRDNSLNWVVMLSVKEWPGAYHVPAGALQVDKEDVQAYVTIRMFFGFLVNVVFGDFILYTLPLVLMSNDSGLDFVKDCLALAFIMTLDDNVDANADTEICAKIHEDRYDTFLDPDPPKEGEKKEHTSDVVKEPASLARVERLEMRMQQLEARLVEASSSGTRMTA